MAPRALDSRTMVLRFFVACFSALCALLALTRAAAAVVPEARALAIVADGAGAEALARSIAGKLPAPWTRADAAAFAKALRAEGQTSAVGRLLDAPRTRASTLAELERAARASHADALVVLRMKPGKSRGGRSVAVLVLEPGAANPIVERDVALGAAPSDDDAEQVLGAFGPELARIAAPTAPHETKPPKAAPSPASPPSAARAAEADNVATVHAPRGVAYALLDASLGLEFASRHLTYNDRVTNNLRAYDVDGVPTAALDLQLYPLARSGVAVLKDLGFVGEVRRAFLLNSATTDGTKVSTEWTRFDAGLRGRMRFGGARPMVLGLRGSYGQETFKFADGANASGELPSVGYKLLRAMLDARVPVGPIAVVAAFGYLHVLEAGSLQDRLRGTKVAGIEARLGASVPLGSVLEARLTVDYTRFFYAFSPVPGDAAVAGGALDHLVRAGLAIAFVY